VDQPGELGLLSREELLGGLPARRASTLLFAIESRTGQLVVRTRQAAARFATERSAEQQERAFLDALAQGRELPLQARIQDLERYAAEWASLVPADPGVRAAVAGLLAGKYAFTYRDVPQLRQALGLDDAAVVQAYERLYGRPLRAIFAARSSWQQRLRWAQARLAQRLETLPPFWTVFALTLTEIVGAGILALPIAVAGVGALGGIALLLALGLVNLLTIAALSEAFTRDGNVRYGHTYFGRLVADYLGSSGSPVLTRVLLSLISLLVLAYCLGCLLAYCIGVSSTLADVTRVPAPVWAMLLLAVIVYFLRRETLNATIASALVIGAINLSLIVLLTLLALPHVSAANLLAGKLAPVAGGPFDPALLGLIFGVITAAYFGHFSTGTSARLVLSRDPTGRALLLGNVAAMGVTMVLYCLWVMAVNGALPPSALLGQSGTALRPLAAHIGPVVNVFGGLFVILGMGMGSIHYSLALMNQVRDWLPVDPGSGVTPKPRRAGALAWRIATNRHTRFLLGVAPVVLIFGVGEWQLLTGQASFAAPLGVLGVLSLSVLSGTFPALLLAASRRKGECVPALVPRVLGHPVVLLGVYVLFAASFFVHGLVIWEHPLQRLAALVVGVAVICLTVIVVRRGAFVPRAVVELRVDAGPDQQSQATVNVIARGQPAAAELLLEYRSGNVDVRAGVGTLGPLGVPRSAHLELPGTSARQLKVWTHRVTPTGDSEALAAHVEVRSGGESRQLDLHECAGQAVVPLSGTPYRVTISL
jgi:amino acid permease